tara:strand:+ start:393 stop:596 length:204 start_codon:yes stop_codon:yes gene_type:complete
MDFSEALSYVLAVVCIFAGALIMWGSEDYMVPTSGRSLRIPCSFLFWVLAVIFYAMAIVIEDEDNLI